MKGIELYGTKVMPPVNAMPAGFDGWQCRTRRVQYVRRFSPESRLIMHECTKRARPDQGERRLPETIRCPRLSCQASRHRTLIR